MTIRQKAHLQYRWVPRCPCEKIAVPFEEIETAPRNNKKACSANGADLMMNTTSDVFKKAA
jgi:hypothetical protein